MKARNYTWENWAYFTGWSSALNFIAEWQFKCLLKIKQNLCLVTVQVIRATLTALNQRNLRLKNKKGKPKVSLAKFPPSDTPPSGLWLSSPCWDGRCAWGWQSRRGVHLCKGVYWNPLWCGKIKKGQSTDVGYAWKGLRFESTWKLLSASVYLNTAENPLRQYRLKLCWDIQLYVFVVCYPLKEKKYIQKCYGTSYRQCVLWRMSPGFGMQYLRKVRKWQTVVY